MYLTPSMQLSDEPVKLATPRSNLPQPATVTSKTIIAIFMFHPFDYRFVLHRAKGYHCAGEARRLLCACSRAQPGKGLSSAGKY